MAKISLTEFVDFVAKAGTPKLTHVRTVKQNHLTGYDPRTDFYKSFRDGLVHFHQQGKPRSVLDQLVVGQTDTKKQTAYPDLLKGYKKFLGRKNIGWFTPPHKDWTHSGLTISINPELGLDINGTRHAIKLYFKADKLTKFRMDAVTQLMNHVLTDGPTSPTFSILDVRNGKLISSPVPQPSLMPLLEGEAMSFAAMYSQISVGP
jgi:hypothetical protein